MKNVLVTCLFQSRCIKEVRRHESFYFGKPACTQKNSDFQLTINNLEGIVVKTLANGNYKPGYYRFKWDRENDGQKSATGLYIYRLSVKDFRIQPMQKKLIIY